jgi:hypothetical protein
MLGMSISQHHQASSDSRPCFYQRNCIFSPSDEFYALFYLALFNEVRNIPSKAELYLRQSLGTRYAQLSNDYMVACAKVQARERGWS